MMLQVKEAIQIALRNENFEFLRLVWQRPLHELASYNKQKCQELELDLEMEIRHQCQIRFYRPVDGVLNNLFTDVRSAGAHPASEEFNLEQKFIMFFEKAFGKNYSKLDEIISRYINELPIYYMNNSPILLTSDILETSDEKVLRLSYHKQILEYLRPKYIKATQKEVDKCRSILEKLCGNQDIVTALDDFRKQQNKQLNKQMQALKTKKQGVVSLIQKQFMTAYKDLKQQRNLSIEQWLKQMKNKHQDQLYELLRDAALERLALLHLSKLKNSETYLKSEVAFSKTVVQVKKDLKQKVTEVDIQKSIKSILLDINLSGMTVVAENSLSLLHYAIEHDLGWLFDLCVGRKQSWFALENNPILIHEDLVNLLAVKDALGRTLVHVAMQHNRYELIERLVELGFDLSLENNAGTPAYAAHDQHAYSMVTYAGRPQPPAWIEYTFIKLSKGLDARKAAGCHLLFMSAILDDKHDLIDRVLDYQPSYINLVINSDGDTLLHAALKANKREYAFELLLKGADPRITNAAGTPAYKLLMLDNRPLAHSAVYYGHLKAFIRLTQIGIIDLTYKDGNNQTLLELLSNEVRSQDLDIGTGRVRIERIFFADFVATVVINDCAAKAGIKHRAVSTIVQLGEVMPSDLHIHIDQDMSEFQREALKGYLQFDKDAKPQAQKEKEELDAPYLRPLKLHQRIFAIFMAEKYQKMRAQQRNEVIAYFQQEKISFTDAHVMGEDPLLYDAMETMTQESKQLHPKYKKNQNALMSRAREGSIGFFEARRRREEEERKRQEEERKRQEEEHRKQEDARKRQDEEHRKQEDARRRQEDVRRKQEDARRKQEDARREQQKEREKEEILKAKALSDSRAIRAELRGIGFTYELNDHPVDGNLYQAVAYYLKKDIKPPANFASLTLKAALSELMTKLGRPIMVLALSDLGDGGIVLFNSWVMQHDTWKRPVDNPIFVYCHRESQTYSGICLTGKYKVSDIVDGLISEMQMTSFAEQGVARLFQEVSEPDAPAGIVNENSL